jgi:hypothetical protein
MVDGPKSRPVVLGRIGQAVVEIEAKQRPAGGLERFQIDDRETCNECANNPAT